MGKKKSPFDLTGNVMNTLEDFEGLLSNSDLDMQVEVGSLLDSIIARANTVAERARTSLRDAAVNHLKGPGTHTFNGAGASQATVIIPNPSLRLQKDADVDLLKKMLGGEFERFFSEETKYTLRSEFKDRRASCTDPSHSALLDKFVVAVENTPRVLFKRMDHALKK